MRVELPSGTVTFLFTDVEGSTRLLHELGAEAYADALAEHRRVIREACAARDGVEVDTQGDAFFFAFPTAPGAVDAASRLTEALAVGPIQVRVGLHTGTPLVTDEGYVGDDVHFAARVAAAGHGGQVIVSSATAEAVEVALVDLGEHRLKDIADPVSIFQLGDGSFPPLKTISNTNLPRPASSFLGREGELAEVVSRIEGGARLATLTGPGGTGKTRLALEAASSLVGSYKAGVFWVGLASLRDPALVAATIAQTLGAKDGLADHIGEREMLLLLDNLEQVIEAAPELATLVESCPHLTLLVTSRELLRVRGEVEYAVPPLAEPEAVSLFCERSQLEPTDEIAELCARLDSLPLAVELAAARTKALSPAQILERLSQRLDLLRGGRDADPRQQTLRTTIEWSYDLLSSEERQLFARLSVFVGGCTLEAAEEVADADLETLQSLVEKSLLRFTDGRYWMLETIREYAASRLHDSGEETTVVLRHAAYYHALATSEMDSLNRLDERSAAFVRRVTADVANVRAAATHALHHGAPDLAVDLAAGIGFLWIRIDRMREGRIWLEQFVREAPRTDAVRTARLLIAAGRLASFTDDHERAQELYQEACAYAERGGDDGRLAWAQLGLGQCALERAALSDARSHLERSRVLADADDRQLQTLVLGLLAEVERGSGNAIEADAHDEASLRIAREAMTISLPGLLANHATRALIAADLGRARELYIESLRLGETYARQQSTPYCLGGLAVVAAGDGELHIAGRLWGAMDASERDRSPLLASAKAAIAHALQTQLHGEHASFDEAVEEGRRLSQEEAVSYALASLD